MKAKSQVEHHLVPILSTKSSDYPFLCGFLAVRDDRAS